MYNRKIEDELLRLKGLFRVVTVTGPRQSGKTTLVKHAFPDYTYVNLEDEAVISELQLNRKAFLEHHCTGLIIDEVQRMPELISAVQVVVDETSGASVVLTGSNNLQLMQRVTQSLAGRTAVLTLLPLSIEELTGNDRLLSCFKLMYNGFYPAVWAQNLPAQDMYRQYFNTYIQRDIRQVLNVKNLDEFRKFLVIAASRIGTEFNAQSISNELGVSLPTVLEWMNVLEATYVAFRLRPFYRNIGKRLIKTPKIYFYDVGLVCYLLGITKPSQLETHPLRGQVFENMVVCEFIKYQFNRGRDNDIYFFRDRSQREVDIVIDRGLDELHAFEVKLASTIHPDFYNNLKYFRSLFTDQTRTTQVINTGASSVYSPETGHINFWDIPTTLTRIEDTTH